MTRHPKLASLLRRTGLAAGVLVLGSLFVLPALAADGRGARRAVDDGRIHADVMSAAARGGKHYKKRGKGHVARRYGKSDRYRDERRYNRNRHRYDRGYRYDRGRHGHRYERHRHGGLHVRFEIPVRLSRRDYGHYSDWYEGDYHYDDHRHRHRVYRFPYHTRAGVRYRSSEYCDGRLFDRGYVSYRDSRLSIELGF